MIRAFVKGVIERKVFRAETIWSGGHYVESYREQAESKTVDTYSFEEIIPQVGDKIMIGLERATVKEIVWIDGNTIEIKTDHVIEVIEDERTEETKKEAEGLIKELDDMDTQVERELAELRKAPIHVIRGEEKPKKKGWFGWLR